MTSVIDGQIDLGDLEDEFSAWSEEYRAIAEEAFEAQASGVRGRC